MEEKGKDAHSTATAPKRVLVCAAWPYVNNIPHFGTILSFFSADVIARYYRAQGADVAFVSGSDVHGTPIEVAARKENTTPQAIAEKYHPIVKEHVEKFGISFSNYTTTASKNHAAFVTDFYKTLHEKNFIKYIEEELPYSEKDKMFLPDRYVKGTCPHCGYEEANWDQCENCGAQLNPGELLKAKSTVSGDTPIIKKTTNAYFALPQITEQLQEYVNKTKEKWTSRVTHFTESWFKQGLIDRAITRDISWGIPAPFPKLEHKTLYVWAEAVLGYLSAVQETNPQDLELFWKQAIDASYFCMGKDNTTFHSVFLPALLFAHGNYNLPEHMVVSEFISFEGKKFSKSKGIGIWVNEALELLPADYWRYYLLRIFPEQKDTDFSFKDFEEKINTELLANLVNLFNRVITLTDKYFEGKVPEHTVTSHDEILFKKLDENITKIQDYMHKGRVKMALDVLMQASQTANQYLQELEPWKKEENKTHLKVMLQYLAALSRITSIFMPHLGKKMCDALQIKTDTGAWSVASLTHIDDLQKVTAPEQHLITKINGKELQEKLRRIRAYGSFAKLDLRVAKIMNVENHPNADKLYKITVDLGDEQRQVIAGLKAYLSPKQLLDKHAIMVCNLAPVKLRGELSQGMLLAGEDKKNVNILTANDSKPGSQVTLEGIEQKPAAQISFDEFLAVTMTVHTSRAICGSKMLQTLQEDVFVENIENGGKIR